MKHLLWLARVGLGEREKPGAPTIWNTIEGYIAAGWKVWILDAGTSEDTPLGERDYGDGLVIFRFNPPFLAQSRIRKLGWFFQLAQVFYIQRRLIREADRVIRDHGLSGQNTVVYGAEVTAARAARTISLRYGMPLVTRFYGTTMYPVPCTLFNRLRCFPHYQGLAVPADLVIMTNDGTRGDQVLDRVGNKSPRVFWRNGVDLPKQEDVGALPVDCTPGDRLLVTLSRLNRWKHVDRAVAAMPKVLSAHPEARLLVIGYGPEQEALSRLARKLGVSDRVSFTGQIPHSAACSYLWRAEIFLSFYDLSNLGNPLMEAMCCGCPVVTLNVGGTDTVITDGVNGLLLPPTELERRIPEAIIRLLDDDELRTRLSEAAGRYARENFWTWDERIRTEIRTVEALLPPGEER